MGGPTKPSTKAPSHAPTNVPTPAPTSSPSHAPTPVPKEVSTTVSFSITDAANFDPMLIVPQLGLSKDARIEKTDYKVTVTYTFDPRPSAEEATAMAATAMSIDEKDIVVTIGRRLTAIAPRRLAVGDVKVEVVTKDPLVADAAKAVASDPVVMAQALQTVAPGNKFTATVKEPAATTVDVVVAVDAATASAATAVQQSLAQNLQNVTKLEELAKATGALGAAVTEEPEVAESPTPTPTSKLTTPPGRTDTLAPSTLPNPAPTSAPSSAPSSVPYLAPTPTSAPSSVPSSAPAPAPAPAASSAPTPQTPVYTEASRVDSARDADFVVTLASIGIVLCFGLTF